LKTKEVFSRKGAKTQRKNLKGKAVLCAFASLREIFLAVEPQKQLTDCELCTNYSY
jgi:hypothetical protein